MAGPLLKRPVVVIDTETTGLPDHEWARVVEIGAVLLNEEGEEVSTFEALMRPDVLDERAMSALQFNHITMEQVQAAEVAPLVWSAFSGWLARSGTDWLTAYNVGFDRLMMERSGWTGGRWAPCIMQRCQERFGYRPKLGSIARTLEIPPQLPAHRALADARTAALVLCALRRVELVS